MKLKIVVLSNEFTQTLLESPFLKKEAFQFDFDGKVCSSHKIFSTCAVNSPVAFKSSFTSAVVRSFGVVTRSILVTRVWSMAFVNVWSKEKTE